MGIPTEVVGSLPRPMELQEAYAAYDAGKISKEDFERAQDKAVEDSRDAHFHHTAAASAVIRYTCTAPFDRLALSGADRLLLR